MPEKKNELVLKGFVVTVQSEKLLGPNTNLIEITDKRISKNRLMSSPSVLSFRFDKKHLDDICLERNDDVEILIKVKDEKK